MTELAMTVWMTAEAMAELLELPEGAYVSDITPSSSGAVGAFDVTIRGHGAPVVPGQGLRSGHAQITRWQLGTNVTRRETEWRLFSDKTDHLDVFARRGL